MSTTKLNAAETWDSVYKAFQHVNFVSYDFQSVKDSLIDYLKLNYAESFNNFIESTNMIAYVELFAYIAEQLAYRVDMNAHEAFMDTAERKASILKHAKLLSYKPSRNIASRGLVKLTGVSITQDTIDSQGNNIANTRINWNDANNPLWKEQFILAMDRVLVRPIGNPNKTFDVGNVVFSQYLLNNEAGSFINGVHSYTVDVGDATMPMELVSTDVDADGPLEMAPGRSTQFAVLYANDGLGDSSDSTGFLIYTKQGILNQVDYTFARVIPDTFIDIAIPNVNDTDVWLNEVSDTGALISTWERVDTMNFQNIYFNTTKNRKKYEITSLENDEVRLSFGNGDYGEMPVGFFQIWLRQSAASPVVIPKNRVVNKSFTIRYLNEVGIPESATFFYSLTSTMQNASASEDIEHIRSIAPEIFYTQNRMVSGQDYNTFLLKNPSILKLRAVNRTFAGQPKHIDWNDSSGAYQNVKIFGDDLRIYSDMSTESIVTNISARRLIDDAISPIMKKDAVNNLMSNLGMYQDIYDRDQAAYRQWPASIKREFIVSEVRNTLLETKFGELNAVLEKTAIQGAIDRHFYGEYTELVTIGNDRCAYVADDPDFKIYDASIARTIDRVSKYNGGMGSGLRSDVVAAYKNFALTYDRYTTPFGNGRVSMRATSGHLPMKQYTIECIREDEFSGVFSVTDSDGVYLGSIESERHVNTPTHTVFDEFELFVHEGTTKFVVGDTFIIGLIGQATRTTVTFDASNNSYTNLGSSPSNGDNVIACVNLLGRWVVTNDLSVTHANTEFVPGNANNADAWVIYVKRNDKPNGDLLNWELTYRTMSTIIESPTTKFWYNDVNSLVDSTTKVKVSDAVYILASNLDRDGNIMTSNRKYDIIGPVKYDDGMENTNAVTVRPTDSSGSTTSGDTLPDNPLQLHQFIRNGVDWVFFKKTPGDSKMVPISSRTRVSQTLTVTGLFNQPANAGATSVIFNGIQYLRRPGRDGINFLWQHFAPNTNVIDPSTTNIIDMYVLTKGFYNSTMDYVRGKLDYVPVPESSLELKSQYKDLLDNRMLSDTVVLHSAKIKLLFGSLADAQLRAKFRVIKSPIATMTDDQIKYEIVNIINEYFNIDTWEFGEKFYATDLLASIHTRLVNQISSVVLVPLYVNNYFGNMLIVECSHDQILQSCATSTDVEIVDTFNAEILRQRT